MDAENVVVDREHVHGGGGRRRWDGHRDLSIVNAGEVASTSWLMFFWLESEGVRVHTWVWGTRVVVVRLELVEVLTPLFLESVLTVEDQLEFIKWTRGFFSEVNSGATSAEGNEWDTSRLADWHVAVGIGDRTRVAVEDNLISVVAGGKVPEGVTGRGVGEAPHQFLDWVVVGQANLLGSRRGHGVGASVLHLLDEVFVTLLRESAALFGVEVDVVGPHLEATVGNVGEFAAQVEVKADFVVLEGNQRQRQSGISVEEEDEWQEDLLTAFDRGGHLTVVGLLGFVKVQLRVQTPPLLVVLVDALTTDGQFNILDHALGQPGIIGTRGGTRDGFDVHVRDKVTVARDGNGNATVRTWGTVDSLFDVFHREVRVTLVHGLEESDFWVARQVDILGTVGDELHETTGHFESFCTIYQENNFAKKLSLIFPGIMYTMTQPEQTKPLDVVESESESEYETESDVGVAIDEDGSQPMEMYEDEDELADFLEDDAIMKIANIAGSLFASEEGDTVCTALVNISKQLEMQNRIMVKILSQMQKST